MRAADPFRYFLTLTSFQPLYGKLSDIFGRKACLLSGYSIFGLGCLFCGFARNLVELVVARAFAGKYPTAKKNMSKPMLIPCIHLGIGGGGMTVVVSILFSDIIPLRERGTWQGYLNIVYAAGFSLGGPLGGLLTDTVGWRWQAYLPPPFKSCLQLLGLSLDNSLSLSLQA